MQKYSLEFILHIQDTSEQAVKSSLTEFGEGLKISDCQDSTGKGKNLRVHISTNEPTVIFDVCSQFGRIRTVKIDEVK